MCGIFGVIQYGPKGFSAKTLKHIARVVESRGQHAFGLTWVDSSGRIHKFKSPGKISEALYLIDRLKGARAIVGHTRHATHGDLTNVNNHPHPADGGWYVHNGQIPNYQDIIMEHDLFPVSDCDSEVLGLLIEKHRGTLMKRVRLSVNIAPVDVPLNMAGVWSRPGRVVLAKRGNPLYIGRGRTGNLYFSSCSGGLPKRNGPMKDNVARVYDLRASEPKKIYTECRLKKYKPGTTRILGSNYFGDDDWTVNGFSKKGSHYNYEPRTYKNPSQRIWPKPSTVEEFEEQYDPSEIWTPSKIQGAKPRYGTTLQSRFEELELEDEDEVEEQGGEDFMDLTWEGLSDKEREEILDHLDAADIEKYLGMGRKK